MFSSIRRMTRAVLPLIVEGLYPKTCAGCGMRGMWLCDLCDRRVPQVMMSTSCDRCGEPVLLGHCGCADLTAAITRARSAFVYDGWVANAVKQVKYGGEWSRAEHLAAVMCPLLAAFGAVDGLIPVPLHRSRERSRGYNQSLILARHLGAASGLPVLDVLRRGRHTESQVTLSGEQRRKNVAGAFTVNPNWVPVAGGRYVVIDDVRTTGATLGACAEALQEMRPSSVGVLTFALDMRRDEISELRRLLRSGTR